MLLRHISLIFFDAAYRRRCHAPPPAAFAFHATPPLRFSSCRFSFALMIAAGFRFSCHDFDAADIAMLPPLMPLPLLMPDFSFLLLTL